MTAKPVHKLSPSEVAQARARGDYLVCKAEIKHTARWTRQKKRVVVQAYMTGAVSSAELARDHMISIEEITAWRKRYVPDAKPVR